ncbi:MAG: N-acetylglucosamine-6-phosphate deacetylase [Clostridia bacterium]|nr:N-acetylglucosamine-6-phosphate deacetylase [Clostridia bacterium]
MITKITNGILIDREAKPGQSVYLENGTILAVTEQNLPYDREYDAGGCYISAGWIDLHTHGGGGYDFMDGGKECIVEGAKMHLLHGTTSLYPTTLSASREALERAVGDVKEAMSFPTIRGVHLEGPYFDPKSCGAQNTSYIRPFDWDEMNTLLSSGIVKRWDFAPELADSSRAAKLLTEAGVVPAMGHSGATYEELLPAFQEGCRLVTHLYSATSTVVRIGGYRHLGIIESAFLLEDMDVEIIADGCHLPLELLRMIYQIKGADRICLVTDSMRAAGMPDGEYILGSKTEGTLCIHEGGVAKLLDRSAFAGSTATADRLIRTMYRGAQIPLLQAVRMMTETPARVMGLKQKGRLCKGYDADLVIFDDEIAVKAVFVNGVCMAEDGRLIDS